MGDGMAYLSHLESSRYVMSTLALHSLLFFSECVFSALPLSPKIVDFSVRGPAGSTMEEDSEDAPFVVDAAWLPECHLRSNAMVDGVPPGWH
jgi:hypothetical protein